jgi:hypothetical protein
MVQGVDIFAYILEVSISNTRRDIEYYWVLLFCGS